jgi:heptosyltransferase-2
VSRGELVRLLDFDDGLGSLRRFAFGGGDGVRSGGRERTKAILVRVPNWVGDALLCTPAIHALRRSFPQATVTAVARSRVRGVFESNPDIDLLMGYEPGERGWGFLSVVRELRKKAWDLAVVFPLSFSSAWMMVLGGVRARLGYGAQGRGFLLTTRVPYPQDYRSGHLVDRYLDLAERAGAERVVRRPRFRVRPQDEDTASAILARAGVGGSTILVGLNPGAVFGPAKRWPAERFVQLGRCLRARHREELLLFGTEGDAEASARMAERIGEGALSLAGRTSLPTLAALLRRCRVLITNDTGTMHLAVAVGTPVISLFGSTAPEWTGPLGEHDQVIRKELPCAPCFQRTCRFGTYECLTRISVAEVLDAARRFW